MDNEILQWVLLGLLWLWLAVKDIAFKRLHERVQKLEQQNKNDWK